MKLQHSIGRTVAGACVFAALAGYVYFYEFRYTQQKAKATEEARKIFNYPKDRVQRIALRQGGGAAVELVRQPAGAVSGWNMTSPVPSLANENKVDTLLAGLLGQASEGMLTATPTPAELDEYELTDAKARMLELTLAGGGTVRGRFGAANPADTAVYYQAEGSPAVLLVPKAAREDLFKDPSFFRDRRIVHCNTADVASIRVEQGDNAFTLVKTGDRWAFEGSEDPVDEARAGNYLMDISTYMAAGFTDQPTEAQRKALQTPALRIRLAGRDKKTLKIIDLGTVLEDQKVQSFVQAGETGYLLTVGADYMGKFARQRSDFVSRKIFTLDASGLEGVTIRVPGKDPVRLERKNFRWLVADPAALKDREAASLTEWLWALQAVEYRRVLGTDEMPVESGAVQVSLAGKDGKEMMRVRLTPGTKSSEPVCLLATGTPEKGYEVAGSVLAELDAMVGALEKAPAPKAAPSPASPKP